VILFYALKGSMAKKRLRIYGIYKVNKIVTECEKKQFKLRFNFIFSCYVAILLTLYLSNDELVLFDIVTFEYLYYNIIAQFENVPIIHLRIKL
jgi:hypothetical protein